MSETRRQKRALQRLYTKTYSKAIQKYIEDLKTSKVDNLDDNELLTNTINKKYNEVGSED